MTWEALADLKGEDSAIMGPAEALVHRRALDRAETRHSRAVRKLAQEEANRRDMVNRMKLMREELREEKAGSRVAGRQRMLRERAARHAKGGKPPAPSTL